MKRFLLRLAFFYPPIYSFFCYRRKHGRREEFEEKARLYYANQNDPQSLKRIIRGVFELRGVRKVMRYLIPWMDRRFIERSVKVEGLQHLEGMLKKGRGVLLMAGHIGVPHLAFNALRVMGYDVILLSGVTPKKARYPKMRYYDTPDRTIFVHDRSLSQLLSCGPVRCRRILRALPDFPERTSEMEGSCVDRGSPLERHPLGHLHQGLGPGGIPRAVAGPDVCEVVSPGSE